MTLYGNKIVHDDLKDYGHLYSLSSYSNHCAKGPKETIRIHSHNVDNLSLYATNVTNQLIINEEKKQDADIHLWQEIGLCWPKVDKYDSWQSRTKGLGFHSNLTCNTTELEHSLSYQSGGIGVVLSHIMAPRVIGKGADIRGLGRWVWTRLQGKAQAVTTISAYRPCKPSSSGVKTVYEQHARELPVLSDPRTQFLIHLKQCTQDREAHGDLIIIGMDLNDL